MALRSSSGSSSIARSSSVPRGFTSSVTMLGQHPLPQATTTSATHVLDAQDAAAFHFRKLGQNQQQQDEGSWLDDYSLKFLGCDASSNHARFRLCPQGACWNKDWMGCRENYGDYAVDMDSYVQALMILWNGVTWSTCNSTAYEECSACYTLDFDDDNGENDSQEGNEDGDGGDGDDDNNNGNDDGNNDDDGGTDDYYSQFGSSEECLYSCLKKTVMPSCYYVLTEEDYFMERYSCGRLENTDYYLGPYCGEDGGGIYIGLFLDDECRQMVDDGSYGGIDTWKMVAGDEVAFTEAARQSLQFTECLRCENLSLDSDNSNNNNDDGGNDDGNNNYNNIDGTTCDQLYQDESLLACETYLPSANQRDYNENNLYDENYNEECYEIDQIPLPRFQDDHSPFYYFRHFALPILIALALLIASQRRNQNDRAQFEDKKEALVGVHGEQHARPQGVMG